MYLHRCLYDNNAEGYKDQVRRNQAWDEIGRHMNVKREQAKDTWEKLRRCFMNAIKRRKTKQLHPWRFEERMSFLYNHIDPSKMYCKLDSGEQPYYSETDDSQLVDDIEATDSRVYDDSLTREASEMTTSIKREENSDGCYGSEQDQNQSVMRFLKPTAISNGSMSDNDSFQDKRPISAVDPQSEPSDAEECNPFKRDLDDEPDNLTRRTKKHKKSREVPVESAPILSSIGNEKDDIDLFFQSMATTTKTLTPIDQAKIKLQISQIVLGAQIVQLQRSTK